VATIGGPNSYKAGLYDRNGKKITKPTYSWLINEFYQSGVDIVRLNLSHLDVDQIAGVFSEIKQAILNCERKSKSSKKMALLADLPGPKIRFQFTKDMTFKVGRTFSINFKNRNLGDNSATVCVGNFSLYDSLVRLDASKLRRLNIQESDLYPTLLGNVLGREFTAGEYTPNSFADMMDQIRTKLRSEKVLVVIGDGDVFMEVTEPKKTSLTCKVVTVKTGDGSNEITLSGNKGFTLKGIDLNIPSFTDTDRDKLDELLKAEYASSHNEKWEPVLAFIALSFVQTADDVLRAREYMERSLRRNLNSPATVRLMAPSLIAKIETDKALQNQDFILDVVDGIMVARGDLGLQKEIEEVPAMQKKLIMLCNKRGKPVITATEMLKSMTESIEPTRAEGTDVFNAILDGSDAVMLSEETAQGKYPFKAIGKMIAIAVNAEQYFERLDLAPPLRRRANLLRIQESLNDDTERVQSNTSRLRESANKLGDVKVKVHNAPLRPAEKDRRKHGLDWRMKLYEEKRAKSETQITTNRITQATCTMSEAEEIKCIIAASTSGRTVRMISRLRPSVLIVGAAHDTINIRKLVISYGVLPISIEEVTANQSAAEMLKECQIKISKDNYLSNFLKTGDAAVFTGGTPVRHPGTTNLVQMVTIGANSSSLKVSKGAQGNPTRRVKSKNQRRR
jgi:pyruvate kinase